LLGAKSILRLNGNELDDKAKLMQSGFVFNNLNVKGTCRCGTPFST
jgi:Fe-S cluster assembly iron-binding protein IscA